MKRCIDEKTVYLLSEMCCIVGNGVCLLFMKFCMDLYKCVSNFIEMF